jgi:phosphate transport system permease protein
MTDLSAPTSVAPRRKVDFASSEAKARVRQRYRSEARFRAYGLTALVITALFVCVLMADILFRGLPAFTQHSLLLDVPLTAEKIDPEGKKSPEATRSADYAAISRDALSAAIPGIEGRQARKQLAEILSSGAGDGLRAMVVADPDLIGQTVKARLLLSDDADLYFKGTGTRISYRDTGRGIATPSATKGEVKILASANDFADELVAIKRQLAVRAEKLRKDADRLERVAAQEQAEKIAELRSEAKVLQDRYEAPSAAEFLDHRMPSLLIAINGGIVKVDRLSDSEVNGETIIPLKSAEEAKPGSWLVITYETPEADRRLSDRTVTFLERLKSDGKVERHFNALFFTAGDSREPELAGIRGALVGSVLTLLVTLGLALPIGVLAAIYLEEFASKNWLTDLIEININNLAAVPSIVFGLLGLAVFLNFFGLPRSAPLVGGLVLALLVLPTIIISARAALKAVPPSITEAALGVGASKQQAIFHHVLPLALPGIMTGTIIGMAHALGETAPLLMIGMIAFVVDIPSSFTEAATALPVQIYLWSDLPEAAFKAKTAAAIIVLLVFLFLMNGLAIWIRRKFERRW